MNEEPRVIECPECELKQPVLPSGFCRRCNSALEPVAVPAVPVPAPRAVAVPGEYVPHFSHMPIRADLAVRVGRMVSGMSQRDLAGRMGVPRTYISKVENGGTVPNIRNVLRFADAMSIPRGVFAEMCLLRESEDVQ